MLKCIMNHETSHVAHLTRSCRLADLRLGNSGMTSQSHEVNHEVTYEVNHEVTHEVNHETSHVA